MSRLQTLLAALSRSGFPLRRQVCSVLTLLPFFAGTYCAAFWLRFEGQIPATSREVLWGTLAIVVLIKMAVFAWFRIYQGWGRFITFHDLVALGKAVTCCSLVTVLVGYILFPHLSIPRSVFFMDWGAMIVGIGGTRAVLRLLGDRQGWAALSSNRTAVLIVGANDSGEALLRAIQRNQKLDYQVVGFVTDNPQIIGTRIAGVPIVGTLGETRELSHRYGATEVLIAASELSGKQIRRLVEDTRECGVRVKVVPSYEQLLGGSVDVQPRQVAISDLLRRKPIRLDMRSICQWLDRRVLMVTGSAGSIGSEICRQLLQLSPTRIVLVDRSENGQFHLERELRQLAPDVPIDVLIADITDPSRMDSLFMRCRPDIVFHAAAYKHVPLMEDNPGEAVKNIILSTKTLADLAERYGVTSFVMISTDKAVNPTSVMGTCKRVAELYVQSLAEQSRCRFVTVRFGNVLDSAGSVVPIFREQIARGGPVTVTSPEMKRYFMTIPEASQLVIQAGAMGQGGEIFVLDMGQPVRIVDLAADMIRLSGLQVGEDIEIEFTGMRPGEKLYEELHVAGEKHLATSHPKIVIAASGPVRRTHISEAIRRLGVCADGPDGIILSELHYVVPQFHTLPDAGQSTLQAA